MFCLFYPFLEMGVPQSLGFICRHESLCHFDYVRCRRRMDFLILTICYDDMVFGIVFGIVIGSWSRSFDGCSDIFLGTLFWLNCLCNEPTTPHFHEFTTKFNRCHTHCSSGCKSLSDLEPHRSLFIGFVFQGIRTTWFVQNSMRRNWIDLTTNQRHKVKRVFVHGLSTFHGFVHDFLLFVLSRSSTLNSGRWCWTTTTFEN
mmetsp:Transcript_22316/g.41562  ORF Transcript_22316/g.41562 Transcript_22316/m.41562 type:complete len:201 (+) Transcript_22316:320-922(+)